MKKSFSRFVAVALIGTLSLSMTSYADTASTQTGDIVGNSAVKAPTYVVTVPIAASGAALTINPMMLGGSSVKHQLYSAPMFIQNKSDVPIEMNLKITPVVAGTPKPAPKTEDEVQALSADITKVDKAFTMYAAPATLVTLNVAEDDLKANPTDVELTFAKPTNYIGTGTTFASFTAILASTDKGTYPGDVWTWAKPEEVENGKGRNYTVFQIVGSVNKNADWKNKDIEAKVSYQFSGVDGDSFALMSPLNKYTAANLSKAVSGTGAFVLTPRFREEAVSVTALNTTIPLGRLELGATAAAYLKANPTSTFAVTLVAMSRDGVVDTITLPAANLATSFTIAEATGEESGNALDISLTSAAAKNFKQGSTYSITGLTLKIGAAATGNTFAIGANGGINLVVTPDATPAS